MRKLRITVKDHVSFVCGFCGMDCLASTDPAAVMHYLPMCPQYDKLEPDAFMKASREEHQRKGTDPVTGKKLN